MLIWIIVSENKGVNFLIDVITITLLFLAFIFTRDDVIRRILFLTLDFDHFFLYHEIRLFVKVINFGILSFQIIVG